MAHFRHDALFVSSAQTVATPDYYSKSLRTFQQSHITLPWAVRDGQESGAATYAKGLSSADIMLQVAPAMNTHMWDSLFTSQHIAILEQQLGVHVIPPVSKALACGDVGTGAMAEPSSIAQAVQSSLTAQHSRDLQNSARTLQS